MAGLSVGIPALVAYKWVLSRADAFVLELEELALLVLDHLSGAEDSQEPGA
jgi:biopolymer transport protein ExbB/TolQ